MAVRGCDVELPAATRGAGALRGARARRREHRGAHGPQKECTARHFGTPNSVLSFRPSTALGARELPGAAARAAAGEAEPFGVLADVGLDLVGVASIVGVAGNPRVLMHVLVQVIVVAQPRDVRRDGPHCLGALLDETGDVTAAAHDVLQGHGAGVSVGVGRRIFGHRAGEAVGRVDLHVVAIVHIVLGERVPDALRDAAARAEDNMYNSYYVEIDPS